VSRPPNVVLINCDDLGYGDLGCYGSSRNDSPNIDRLAAEGRRFTQFYMASPVCSPSRGALLTGCYPPRIGFGSFDGYPVLFPGQGCGLPPTEVSLARMLGDAGYRTQMIGKWHCGDQPDFLPTNHGFEGYLGLPYSNDMGRQSSTHPALPEMPPLPLLDGTEVIEQQPDQTTLTDRYVAEALRFIAADDDRPFLLYLAHMHVHLPLYVHERFHTGSRNGPYGAAVAAIDWATGAILDQLADLGMADDTIVVFTSDNGSLGDRPAPLGGPDPIGGSNLPLRGFKGTTFEGGMRVPMIVRWPGRVPAGDVSDALSASIDLFPSLATVCRATVLGDRVIDGIDLDGVFFGDESVSARTHFAYYRGNDLEAVRDGRHKLFLARERTECTELYDLIVDPGETTDIASGHPDVVKTLTAFADTVRHDLGDRRLDITGKGVRPIGRVTNPATLTVFDPDHPYVVAEYDLPERG
jgi:arylsulfatase A-like enzyme